jgi:hypothetical protein
MRTRISLIPDFSGEADFLLRMTDNFALEPE